MSTEITGGWANVLHGLINGLVGRSSAIATDAAGQLVDPADGAAYVKSPPGIPMVVDLERENADELVTVDLGVARAAPGIEIFPNAQLTAVTGEITAATKVFRATAGSPFTTAMVGMFVRITAAANPGNNGIWEITSRVDADNVVLGNATTLVNEGVAFGDPAIPWTLLPDDHLAGRSLTVWSCTGTAGLKFSEQYGSQVNKPIAPLTYPAMITFKEREFTKVYVENVLQAGQSLVLYVGQRK